MVALGSLSWVWLAVGGSPAGRRASAGLVRRRLPSSRSRAQASCMQDRSHRGQAPNVRHFHRNRRYSSWTAFSLASRRGFFLDTPHIPQHDIKEGIYVWQRRVYDQIAQHEQLLQRLEANVGFGFADEPRPFLALLVSNGK